MALPCLAAHLNTSIASWRRPRTFLRSRDSVLPIRAARCSTHWCNNAFCSARFQGRPATRCCGGMAHNVGARWDARKSSGTPRSDVARSSKSICSGPHVSLQTFSSLDGAARWFSAARRTPLDGLRSGYQKDEVDVVRDTYYVQRTRPIQRRLRPAVQAAERSYGRCTINPGAYLDRGAPSYLRFASLSRWVHGAASPRPPGAAPHQTRPPRERAGGRSP
jgi:hypothetical protein